MTLPRSSKSLGFTLIELMVTVAVVGILASLAYPSFMDQIRKGRRADAEAALLNLGSRQQQMLLDTRSYAATVSALNVSVQGSVLAWYDITISAPVPTATAPVPSFTITAAPKGDQVRDKCGALVLDQNGTKTTSPVAAIRCW